MTKHVAVFIVCFIASTALLVLNNHGGLNALKNWFQCTQSKEGERTR